MVFLSLIFLPCIFHFPFCNISWVSLKYQRWINIFPASGSMAEGILRGNLSQLKTRVAHHWTTWEVRGPFFPWYPWGIGSKTHCGYQNPQMLKSHCWPSVSTVLHLQIQLIPWYYPLKPGKRRNLIYQSVNCGEWNVSQGWSPMNQTQRAMEKPE